jgi:dGTPase
MGLASYAVTTEISKGRATSEKPPSDCRSEFQRDRDRVFHSAAFRRLQWKTQVFTDASRQYAKNPSDIRFNDQLRNRMTHSLEVSQVSRSLARALSLNEDLVEVLSISHDLGHPPFGHTGQDILNEHMRPYGGFEHNLQSLRIVDRLDNRYPDFKGMNLMFETREGILKHCSVHNARQLGDIASRFIEKKSPTLEAQCMDLGDAVAYACHDIDDGLRSGLISVDSMCASSFFARHWLLARGQYPDQAESIVLQVTLRDMLGSMVRGIIRQSLINIKSSCIVTLEDVRNAGNLIALPDDLAQEHSALKSHLYHTLYSHPAVSEVRKDATTVIGTLFPAYMDDFKLIPFSERQGLTEHDLPVLRARVVSDYISGMTDRYAYESALVVNQHASLRAALGAQI